MTLCHTKCQYVRLLGNFKEINKLYCGDKEKPSNDEHLISYELPCLSLIKKY